MTEIEIPATRVELEESTPEGAREMAAARAEVRVSHLLRKAFRLSGLSQKDLADRLSVSEGRVSQVLRSGSNPRVTTIARYLRAMGYRLVFDAEPAQPGVKPLKAARVRRGRKNIAEQFFVSYSPPNSENTQDALLITRLPLHEKPRLNNFGPSVGFQVDVRDLQGLPRGVRRSSGTSRNMGYELTSVEQK